MVFDRFMRVFLQQQMCKPFDYFDIVKLIKLIKFSSVMEYIAQLLFLTDMYDTYLETISKLWLLLVLHFIILLTKTMEYFIWP